MKLQYYPGQDVDKYVIIDGNLNVDVHIHKSHGRCFTVYMEDEYLFSVRDLVHRMLQVYFTDYSVDNIKAACLKADYEFEIVRPDIKEHTWSVPK